MAWPRVCSTRRSRCRWVVIRRSSREVGRHGGRAGYRAVAADTAACAVRERPKVLAVERSPRLRAVVCRQLRGGWSPASIAGRLATDYPEDQACRVSHEAIVRHEAPGNRVEVVGDLHHRAVAAVR